MHDYKGKSQTILIFLYMQHLYMKKENEGRVEI